MGQCDYIFLLPLPWVIPSANQNGIPEARRTVCGSLAESEHPKPPFPCFHKGHLVILEIRRKVDGGELHGTHVEQEQFVDRTYRPTEASVRVVALSERSRGSRMVTDSWDKSGPTIKCDGVPLSGMGT